MDMTNKVCLVTGANSGIGKETAKTLAGLGAFVVMLCRNEERAEHARQEIIGQTGHTGVEVILADLAHQYDIHRAAEQFREKFEALDVLINNAGIIPAKREETPEGIEKTLAINHLGPFLLTNLLMEQLKNADHARIINVASEVHRLGAPIFDINNLQLQTRYSPMKAYGLSKLCNIMFTHELAKRLSDTTVTANCLHPGVVNTRLASDASWLMKLFYFIGTPFMRSPKKGAQTSLYLAISDEVSGISGQYFKNKQITAPASIAFDDELTEKLWKRSETLTGLN
ncbi:MAG: SDR family oxidoreductase [Balneolaceae bacterium]|nr:SDR family oxidoreductase [Balneolaceae bacterium]